MIYWRTMEEGLKKAEQTAFARTLLLDALRKEYGITRLPEITRTPYGKPYFLNYPELYFNYSHSKHAAACVLSRQAVGIDLEQIRNYSEKTAQRFCSQGEWSWLQRQPDLNKAWIQIWTMKEAWLKYRGTGLRVDLRDLDFTAALENASAQKEITVLEHGQMHTACMYSYFIEDFWMSVCGKEKNNNHMLHLL